MLRHGADPTVADKLGNTALHYACGACDLPVARLLMRAGADPRARNAAGHTPGEEVAAAAAVRSGATRGGVAESPASAPNPCNAAHLIFDALDGRA